MLLKVYMATEEAAQGFADRLREHESQRWEPLAVVPTAAVEADAYARKHGTRPGPWKVVYRARSDEEQREALRAAA